MQQSRLSTKIIGFTILHTIIVVIFLKGFLLTRIELPDVSQCSQQTCSGHKPYAKAVVLIVDALRYDFLCTSSNINSSYSEKLPRTVAHVSSAGPAAVAARFVADTPTITMSRLKALLTGGLPTFLDIGQSFSASALTEDNLLQQLLMQGRRLVVMGDDTWMQLAKDAFTEAYPYPSFDVHDLHTVDDGVWQHLVPLLSQPARWDVLIAHYLGVDHAGHTYGVNSRQMTDKLEQMDQQISEVIEYLVPQAGPGGVHENTLLLVLSDHGQTQGGDHGGGTPAETDSVLIAMSLRKMHQVNLLHGNSSATNLCSSELLGRLVAAGGYSDRASPDGLSPQRLHSTPGPWFCNSSMSQIDLTPLLANLLGVAVPFGNLGKIPPHLYVAMAADGCCAGSRQQLTGKDNGQEPQWLKQYAEALSHNVHQVWRYLSRYAEVGGLPTADLAAVSKLYAEMTQLHSSFSNNTTAIATTAPPSVEAALAGNSTEELVCAQLAFLSAAADLARQRFTLFQQTPMWLGCALGVIVLACQVTYCWHVLGTTATAQSGKLDLTSIIVFTGLVAFHCVGLFSVGLLMGEGRLQCVLLAVATLLLLRATLRAVQHAYSLPAATPTTHPVAQQLCVVNDASVPSVGAGRADRTPLLLLGQGSSAGQQSIVMAGEQIDVSASSNRTSHNTVVRAVCAAVLMLACNAALQALGLIDRSGQDPHDKTQPTSDLLVGPDAALHRVLLLCWTIAPLLCIWAGAEWLSAWFRHTLIATSNRPATCSWLDSSLLITVKFCCAISYGSIGIFWIAQLTGCNRLAARAAVSILWQQTVGLVLVHAGSQHVYTFVMMHYKSTVAMTLQPLTSALRGSLVDSTLELPLQLLLPRVVYVSALAAFGAVLLYTFAVPQLLALCQGSAVQNVTHGRLSKAARLQQQSALSIYCQTLVWLSAAFAAALTMVLGYKGPVTVLLAVLQAAGCCMLLQMHAAASRCMRCKNRVLKDAGSHDHTRNICCSEADSVTQGHAGVTSVLGSGTWGMMGLQLFFCSSHFCEFSGLQYASAFIGFDSMMWFQSGSLLLLNTYGFLFFSCLTLPLMLMCCMVGAELQQWRPLKQQLTCSVFAMSSVRLAALVVCMVSAAVQQQHILLWAIFAPKLVFELFFMFTNNIGQLLAVFIMEQLLQVP